MHRLFDEQAFRSCPVSDKMLAISALKISGNKKIAVQRQFYGAVFVFFNENSVAMQGYRGGFTGQSILGKTGCSV